MSRGSSPCEPTDDPHPSSAVGGSEERPARTSGGPLGLEPVTAVDQLDLPPALERVGGHIRVAGHRVSLFHVLDALLDGTSSDRMREMFPTIPPPKLEEVLSFCKQHPDLMRRYHAERRAAFAAGAGGRVGEAPSLAELRRRRAGGGPDPRNDSCP